MNRLVELGVDPLALTDDGSSVLDFAIAAENDRAVNPVLDWFSEAAPESLELVQFSITVSERTGHEAYAEKLNSFPGPTADN